MSAMNDDALVFDKPSRLVKGIDPNDERFVLGIVLEPEVVDAQGDIYSADEIREIIATDAQYVIILAGDHLKSASDLGLPLVGVGLLYRQGYFRQYLNNEGWQQEYYPENDFYNLPLTLERDQNGAPVEIELEFGPRRFRFNIWRVQVGRVPLYLLDANIGAYRLFATGVTLTWLDTSRTSRLSRGSPPPTWWRPSAPRRGSDIASAVKLFTTSSVVRSSWRCASWIEKAQSRLVMRTQSPSIGLAMATAPWRGFTPAGRLSR